ncbi:hypothetical protein Hanom_Chr03g00215091 [Helianthus anomalus]
MNSVENLNSDRVFNMMIDVSLPLSEQKQDRLPLPLPDLKIIRACDHRFREENPDGIMK